jgi:hypothetical protein
MSVVLLAGCVAGGAVPAFAQVVYSESYPDNYPPPLPARQGPQPPPIVLEWEGETAVRGPLLPGPLGFENGEVLVPTADGVVGVSVDGDQAAEPRGDAAPPAARDLFDWVLAGDGRHRARALPDGGLAVEKRRKEGARWRRAWRLPTSSPLSSPPIPLDRRLVYATAEGSVIAVRLSNGHRLWATDLGERLSRAAEVWSASLPTSDGSAPGPAALVSLLLVVPDSGVALLAVDVYDGRVLARGGVPEGKGRLVSPPLLLRDGRIVVARQGYALEDAGLGFFRVRLSPREPAAGAKEPVPYNDPEASENSPKGR